MNKKYLNKLLVIAVPIMLSNVISQLQMIIDRIFLGQLNTYYMSALGNVTTPLWTTMSFCFSLSMGASILISQSVGASDNDNIECYAASMAKWANVIPIALFFFWLFGAELVFKIMGVADSIMPYCLGYTRFYAPIFLIIGIEGSFMVITQTSNYTKPLVWYGVIRAGLNVVLDYVLIFGKFGFPALGIEGAAIATTIAEYLGCFLSFLLVVGNKKMFTMPSFKSVVVAKINPYIQSVKLGINAALEDFTWNFGNLAMMKILNSINDLAAGIYSIVFSVEILAVVVVAAIGSGTMTVAGEAKGSKNLKMFKSVCKIAYALCVGVTIVVLTICVIFPREILSLFTSDEAIIASCGIYLIFVCVNLFGKSANIIIGNGIRGSGNTRWMFGTQIFGTIFIICVACIFVYVLKLGISGVFLAVIADELVRAFINFGKLNSIIKKWDD